MKPHFAMIYTSRERADHDPIVQQPVTKVIVSELPTKFMDIQVTGKDGNITRVIGKDLVAVIDYNEEEPTP